MANTHTVIYLAGTLDQAYLLRNALLEEGIFAYVTNDHLYVAGDPCGLPTAPRVVVHESDADDARQIALDFEQSGRRPPLPRREPSSLTPGENSPPNENTLAGERPPVTGLSERLPIIQRPGVFSDIDAELADESPLAWPTCPHCHRPRHTTCPICETAGSNFPRGFDPPIDEAPNKKSGETPGGWQHLVLCPTCDEPFRPQFLARCEWCGHRFSDGRAKSFGKAAPPPEELNARMFVVLAVILLGLAAILVLFTGGLPNH